MTLNNVVSRVGVIKLHRNVFQTVGGRRVTREGIIGHNLFSAIKPRERREVVVLINNESAREKWRKQDEGYIF